MFTNDKWVSLNNVYAAVMQWWAVALIFVDVLTKHCDNIVSSTFKGTFWGPGELLSTNQDATVFFGAKTLLKKKHANSVDSIYLNTPKTFIRQTPCWHVLVLLDDVMMPSHCQGALCDGRQRPQTWHLAPTQRSEQRRPWSRGNGGPPWAMKSL